MIKFEEQHLLKTKVICPKGHCGVCYNFKYKRNTLDYKYLS